ncbi:TIGR00730 family Rossman fold protein [Candidatus Woesearchaeota archaeon]|nr:TIGR00730 family Rossman fold protein [Candidatus Woesearchaeota archaeon]
MTRLHKNKQYLKNMDWTVEKIRQEMTDGLALLNSIDKPIVTVFGGHKVKKGSADYEHCKKLAFELGKKGYAIVSGGGPGIMQAANEGAMLAGAPSIGIKASLLKNERAPDKNFTHKMGCYFMFIRRFLLSIKSEALVFYPGGFGTLNEMFEYATLIKTGMTDKVPMVCVNKEFWQGLFMWIEDKLLKNNLLTSHKKWDLDVFHVVDSHEDIVRIICRK